VLDLLGMHLDTPPRLLVIIDQREAACATRFPASVREWFSIESADALFHENTNEDHLQELTELGDPQEAAQGYLKVATENQGVVAWYIRLGDGDDPPVYDNNDEWNDDLSKTGWRKNSKTFTNFIFDMIATHHFHGWYSGMRLSAIDQQPGPDELRQLRHWFQEGPVTDELDSKVYRFFNVAGLVTIRSVTPEHIARSEAEWAIETDSPDELFEFSKKLWRFGTLSQTLKAESCTPESRAKGDQVLQRLREWAGG
jgi:hypothetical protein